MTNPIITKEEFCKIINQIQEQRKKTEKFSDALEEICDGFIVYKIIKNKIKSSA